MVYFISNVFINTNIQVVSTINVNNLKIMSNKYKKFFFFFLRKIIVIIIKLFYLFVGLTCFELTKTKMIIPCHLIGVSLWQLRYILQWIRFLQNAIIYIGLALTACRLNLFQKLYTSSRILSHNAFAPKKKNIFTSMCFKNLLYENFYN